MTILMKIETDGISGEGLRIIRHFTPNWFAATMGTGILGVCLAQFPSAPCSTAWARRFGS